MDPYEVPKGGLVFGGMTYGCAVPTCVFGRDHNLEFKPGKGARARVGVPNLCVWHFTGAEEKDAAQVHRVLVERSLGVEFVIDREGLIWQMCDPIYVDTFDAGSVNRRSVGVEIISGGLAPTKPGREDRGVRTYKVNGKLVTYVGFYERQMAAVKALADTLAEALAIPKMIAHQPRTLTPEELTAFNGHIGHFHVTNQKLDPGLELFDYLKPRGYTSC